jgi:calcineurin-like phosphoesterase family protein
VTSPTTKELLLHGHTHAHDPLEFGRHQNEINVGLDAWCFEPVNEAELVDNWLHTALSVAE